MCHCLPPHFHQPQLVEGGVMEDKGLRGAAVGSCGRGTADPVAFLGCLTWGPVPSCLLHYYPACLANTHKRHPNMWACKTLRTHLQTTPRYTDSTHIITYCTCIIHTPCYYRHGRCLRILQVNYWQPEWGGLLLTHFMAFFSIGSFALTVKL